VNTVLRERGRCTWLGVISDAVDDTPPVETRGAMNVSLRRAAAKARDGTGAVATVPLSGYSGTGVSDENPGFTLPLELPARPVTELLLALDWASRDCLCCPCSQETQGKGTGR
jgi:hypothetical protein